MPNGTFPIIVSADGDMVCSQKCEINYTKKLNASIKLVNRFTNKGRKMKNATHSELEQIITKMIDDRLLFTAYDVTKTARHAGYHVNHLEVKDVMKSYTFPSHYHAAHAIVSGLHVLVRIPDNADILTYDPHAISEFDVNGTKHSFAMAATTSNAPIGIRKIVLNGTAPIQTSIKFGKTGRYLVPSTLIRKIGYTKGQCINCIIEPGKIVIGVNNYMGATKSYRIDHHHSIRIAGSDFKKAFPDASHALQINVIGSSIELT